MLEATFIHTAVRSSLRSLELDRRGNGPTTPPNFLHVFDGRADATCEKSQSWSDNKTRVLRTIVIFDYGAAAFFAEEHQESTRVPSLYVHETLGYRNTTLDGIQSLRMPPLR